MSGEDVIELGSSDEDVEPVPKRHKPMPNAMVCIPKKLHEITIKPSKANPLAVAKGLNKAITVKKVPNAKPLVGNKTKPNGHVLNVISPAKMKQKVGLNPFSGQQRNVQKPYVIQNKPTNSNKVNVKSPSLMLKKPIMIQNSSNIKLPSSITIKKTITNRPTVMLNVKKKQIVNQRKNVATDILTVELDDDETPVRNVSPQWYLRPEDQDQTPKKEEKAEVDINIEEVNNKEPDTPKFIEITIEDSPIKPIPNKRTHEVGAELAITIDDSPVKVIADKNNDVSGSEQEDDGDGSKSPKSRKKLDYYKAAETVEIEISPIEVTEKELGTHINVSSANVGHIDKQHSSLNAESMSSNLTVTTQECEPQTANTKVPKEDKHEYGILSEFHPVYQNFIELCFQLENSDDMKKIVEKKIKGYYKQVPKSYTESEAFTDMVSSKILSMKAGPEKMYLYIKDIVDELNLQRKLAKAQPEIKEIKHEEEPETIEESDYDRKRRKQIHKLEKTIKKLHRAIQKLEEQEVDFDEEDDSVYILTERYKERMVRVYAKFCQLSNTKMPSEPRIQIDARLGHPSGPAKRLEKWINKKVPIGTPLPFPDFHDVIRCVREANENETLGFNEADIMEEARDLFTRCGKKLQRRRQENEWRLAASRISVDVDPAENSEDLKRKLAENRKVASQKETEIFNKFADRQYQLKLEAVEIGDKEAEESPIESEEEDGNDVNLSKKDNLNENTKVKEKIDDSPETPNQKPEDAGSKESLQEKDKSNEEHKRENDPESPEQTEIIVKEGANLKDTEDKRDDTASTSKDLEQTTNDDKSENVTETFTLSDDSNELESDIDELHILQKSRYHLTTSDSVSNAASSDSADSYEDENINDDVISIEDSSYSENETNCIDSQESNAGSVHLINDNIQDSEAPTTSSPVKNSQTIDKCLSTEAHHAPAQTNNDEYTEPVENILLASSEEDNCDSQEEVAESACVNLRDDLISIEETLIGPILVEIEMAANTKENPIDIQKSTAVAESISNTDPNVSNEKESRKDRVNGGVETNESKTETDVNVTVSKPIENMDVDEINEVSDELVETIVSEDTSQESL